MLDSSRRSGRDPIKIVQNETANEEREKLIFGSLFDWESFFGEQNVTFNLSRFAGFQVLYGDQMVSLCTDIDYCVLWQWCVKIVHSTLVFHHFVHLEIVEFALERLPTCTVISSIIHVSQLFLPNDILDTLFPATFYLSQLSCSDTHG